MSVRLHIERLVLEGIELGAGERPLLQAAMEAELGRLLTEGGIGTGLSGGGAVPSVRASGFEMGAEHDPGRLGRQIAGSVYGGLGK